MHFFRSYFRSCFFRFSGGLFSVGLFSGFSWRSYFLLKICRPFFRSAFFPIWGSFFRRSFFFRAFFSDSLQPYPPNPQTTPTTKPHLKQEKKTATRLDPWEIEWSGYSRKKFLYSFSFYFSFSFLFFSFVFSFSSCFSFFGRYFSFL